MLSAETERLEHSWRLLNGGLTIMTLLDGARFVDGVCVPAHERVSAAQRKASSVASTFILLSR